MTVHLPTLCPRVHVVMERTLASLFPKSTARGGDLVKDEPGKGEPVYHLAELFVRFMSAGGTYQK